MPQIQAVQSTLKRRRSAVRSGLDQNKTRMQEYSGWRTHRYGPLTTNADGPLRDPAQVCLDRHEAERIEQRSEHERTPDKNHDRRDSASLSDPQGSALKHEQVGLGPLPEDDDQGQDDPGRDGVDGTLVARRDDGGQAGPKRLRTMPLCCRKNANDRAASQARILDSGHPIREKLTDPIATNKATEPTPSTTASTIIAWSSILVDFFMAFPFSGVAIPETITRAA